jgi:membrane-associated phospholipid phosphatase
LPAVTVDNLLQGRPGRDAGMTAADISAPSRGQYQRGAIDRRWPARVQQWVTTPTGLRDATLFVTTYLLYSMSRFASISSAATAVAHARSIATLEGHLHLGIEAAVQDFLAHGVIPYLLNYVYLAAQVFVIPAVLLFLYVRGPRRVYKALRNTVLCSWLLALPIYALYPTAPPRLAGLGIVDTVSRDSIVPLNARLTTSLFNPYASVPSMHAGLAVAISVALVIALRHRWSRILAGIWGPLMCVTVLATGNHFVVDVVAGLIVTAAGFTLPILVSRVRESHRAGPPPDGTDDSGPHQTRRHQRCPMTRRLPDKVGAGSSVG